jgi:hypothetical protein
MAVTYYVRTSGDDANGGSSLAVVAQGTDGSTTGSSTVLTSAGAAFTDAVLGHAAQLTASGFNIWRLITARTATTITLSGANISAKSGISYKIGGACATPAKVLSNGNSAEVAFTGGDTLYIGAGSYFGTIYTTFTTSPSYDTSIVGDVTGRFTGDPGEVWLHNFASDLSGYNTAGLSYVPTAGAAATYSSTNVITYTGLQITNPQRLTIDGLNMDYGFGTPPSQGEVSCMLLSGAVKTVNVRNCQFRLPMLLPASGRCAGIQAEIVADPTAPLLIENNVFVVNGVSTSIALANSNSLALLNAHNASNTEAGWACIVVGLTAVGGNGTAGYAVKVQNNVMLSLWNSASATTAGPSFLWYLGYRNSTDTGASMEVYNNLVLGTICVFVLGGGAPNSSSYRHKCYGNLIAPTNWNSAQSAWCINMATPAGHYVEYGNNWFTGGGGTAAWFGTKYSGTYHFDQGTNKGGFVCMPCMDLGDSLRRRGPARSWFGLSLSSPFNVSAMSAGTNGPATDMFGTPRKVTSGGTTFGLMGPVEPPNRGVKETTTVNTGTASMKITGYGSHSFQYPIDSGSSTITIYGRYDSNYTGSNLPRISIRDGAEAGVGDQDVTMTSGSDTWQQLNVSLTATAKGMITVILMGRSDAAAGNTFFDD